MIMATDKRKSQGGHDGTPSKFAKNQQGRSPGGGQGYKGKGKPMGGGGGPGTPGKGKPQQQGKGGSPQKQQQNKPQTPKQEKKGQYNAQNPPPPPKGAKKMEVTKVEQKAPANQHQKGGKGKQNKKAPLDSIARQSKNIHKKKASKNRFQRFQDKLNSKIRPAGACERALKAEQELGRGGRIYTVKIADPPLTDEIIKSWSTGIETAVFNRPVESRQFLVVFKHDADVKKELEKLKKVKFAGANIILEEKIDSDKRVANNPDQIDPFCLYVTNIPGDETVEKLKTVFTKASSVSTPKKHNPKIGTSTKYCFVAFDSPEDALAAFKDNYSATIAGNTIVMRFRRVSAHELKQVEKLAEKPAAPKAQPAKKEAPAKKEQVKAEPESDDDDEEEDSDDDEESGDEVDVKAAPGVEDDDDEDDDEDDDDDDLDDEEEDDDDDDDDEDDE